MTIAEKLESIAQTKSDIAAAIIAKGGTLAADAPFADYAAAIRALTTGSAGDRYPLDVMGYDPDGSLASSIAGGLSRWNTKKPTDSYYGMFNGDTVTRVIPALDFTQTPSLSHFANGATAVTYIPYINALKATTLYAALRMTGAKYIPGINAPLCTDVNMLFNGASVEYIGELNLPVVTDYSALFNGCQSLVAIGSMTLNDRPTSAETMFYDCQSLRQFVAEDFAPATVQNMFVRNRQLQEVRMNMRYATATKEFFGPDSTAWNCPDCAAWLNWGDDSGASMSPSALNKRYHPDQTVLDFRGLMNWGTLHPASLQYTIDNLPMRAYTSGGAGVRDTPCTIQFSAATKAVLTDDQKDTLMAKNYTIA